MRLVAHAQQGEQLNSEIAQHAAPLAKFHTIPANVTGNSSLPGSRTPSVTSTASPVTQSPSQIVVPVLSSQQAASFGAMFDRTAQNGVLPGVQARDIFLKARLPVQILEKIWNLVDRRQTGELTRPQFIVAMHLIQSFLNKSMTILPTVLPEPIWSAAKQSAPPPVHSESVTSAAPAVPAVPAVPSAPSPSTPSSSSPSTNLDTWIMSPQQQQQYGSIFDSLDKAHRGAITGSEVANFLMTSKLSNDVLATIWELANLNNQDDFNRQEFAIAMYLVQKKLAGYELPEETPVELRNSSSGLLSGVSTSVPDSNKELPQQSFSAAASKEPENKSHMDDLMELFASAPADSVPPPPANSSRPVVPPVPVSRAATATTEAHHDFVPSSNFGRQLQQKQQQQPAKLPEEPSSSDDDEGPEDLDRQRAPPPLIPGRDNKPTFSSSDVLEKGAVQFSPESTGFSNQSTGFSNQAPFGNQPADFTNQPTGFSAQSAGFSNQPAVFSNQPTETSASSSVQNQLSKATVDIANFSNQINSLSLQNANVSARKGKAQKELTRVLKVKEDIQSKLAQLKDRYTTESQSVQETEGKSIQVSQELTALQQELSIAEANHHSEEAKLKELEERFVEIEGQNQQKKVQLSTLNAESKQLESQIQELTSRVTQAENILAVTQGQVSSQEAKNNSLRQQIAQLTSSIQGIIGKHTSLSQRFEQLEDEELDLHDKHTDLSAEYVEKNLAYSQALSFGEVEANTSEVPTASLDDFDEEEFNKSDKLAAKAVEGSEKAAQAVIAPQDNTKELNAEEKPVETVEDLTEAKQVNPEKTEKVEEPETVKDLGEGKQVEPESVETEAVEEPEAVENAVPKATEPESTEPEGTKPKEVPEPEEPEFGFEKSNLAVSKQEVAEAGEPLERSIGLQTEESAFGSAVKRASQETISDEPVDLAEVSPSSKGNGESFEFLSHEDAEPEPKVKEEKAVEPEDKEDETKVPSELAEVAGLAGPAGIIEKTSAETTEPTGTAEPVREKADSLPLEAESLPAASLPAFVNMPGGFTQSAPAEPKAEEPTVRKASSSSFDEEFPPIKEHHISDSESSTDQYEDTLSSPVVKANVEKKELTTETPTETPTEENLESEAGFKESTTTVTPNVAPTPSTNPFSANLFDDLGLEEAQVEENDQFDQLNSDFSNPVGFSFTQAPLATAVSGSAEGGDDWEQVFAGFGNDPNAETTFTSTPAPAASAFQAFGTPALPDAGFTDTPTSLASGEKKLEKKTGADLSQFSQSQALAIEELKGMGFDEEKSTAALKKNSWNLDEATNYLLDSA
ncbi:DEKNAAC102174 [Brettanomyces naardenensis]|uniref:DEKNAAC102174 n=1 Tax=Brettanomyces naardenensis TaxID=13370 RepID=A0A448YK29_BRENA|nr:DEKNAAC102174 [Brettanomyces naardenensis]